MSTTTYRVVKVQIHTPVDGRPYKSVSWVWRVETSPLGAFLDGEDGKPLDFDTSAAAEVARFNADPHAWTDENGMRYRCGRCREPLISLLPAELTSGTCRCGGLIEADPRNLPTPAAEPILEGWGALSTTEYREGEEVEVLFPDGWKSGCTFTGYRAGGPDEDFLRINVRLPELGRAAEGCHPDCVRRPFERELDANAFDQGTEAGSRRIVGCLVDTFVGATFCPAHLEPEPCPTCAAYIAAGL